MPDTILYSEYNDTTRIVTTRDQSGSVTNQRPYTTDENAAADARAAQETNEQTLTTNAQGAITALTAIVTDLQTIAAKADADITPADTKDIATQLARIAKQVARITRLVVKAYDASL